MNGKSELNRVLDAALRAGDAILQIYARDFEVEFKADASPLTEADKAAHHIICDALKATGLPILSEESKTVAYEERKGWQKYWLVDPLDGTKEFIKKNGEFTVNIALIENGRPVLGVVYAPVLRTVYCGMSDVEGGTSKAWKATDCAEKSVDEIMTSAVLLSPSSVLRSPSSGLRVVASRSHCNDETRAFIEALEKEFGPAERVSSGSSLKLCMVAEGSADVYPRIAPTMEWDTAAAQAVVEAAGGRVVQYDSAVPAASYLNGFNDLNEAQSAVSTSPETSGRLNDLSYNKPDLLNPFFVVYRA
jgi:3'(2'), 5'-bisphosphate nucleotidase